ncbi:MFS transporter [Paenibacillus sp. y28]|uniref:MFS transporter n=1 Tax=Paenibacillus sp. y28 TaxID=3129110 RepID=UPI003017EFCF
MNKKAVRSWMLYDWANSAFATTMLAAVLPIFYNEVAGANLEGNLPSVYWGYTHSVAMLCVLIIAPALGAVADYAGIKKRILFAATILGSLSSIGFAFVGEGDYALASVLMILGTLAFAGGSTFYDAMLNDLVPYEERDMVSAKGYAAGYIGGALLLIVNMLMIQKPDWFGLASSLAGTYAAFITVGLWWFIFAMPLMIHVKDPQRETGAKVTEYARIGFTRIWQTLRSLPRYPELLKYLVAFWFFNDGISTIITMAAIYGSEVGIQTKDLILALIITQLVGIPLTLVFGGIARRLGSKTSLYISLGVYVVIVMIGYYMSTSWQFYLLAILVGCVQGGSQSIARSIYSKLVPDSRSAEFFGLLNVSSKFSSIIGPLVFGLVGQMTGSSRYAILSLLLFFVVGITMLTKVNLEKGSREAEAG